MILEHQPVQELLFKNGFLHLKDKDEEELSKLVNSLGKVIFITDVVVNPNGRGLVTSERALDFHTDHHKAKYIIWYCYKQTDLGGDSIFIDAQKVYDRLSSEQQKELSKINLFEHKVFPDDKESHPLVLNREDGKSEFYYSFWLLNEDDKNSEALLEFQRIIRETEPIRLNLKENDILIVDNHRMVHGRTAIEGSKDRFLKRFWLEVED